MRLANSGANELRSWLRAADEFGDFDAEVIFDYDDLSVRDKLVVDEQTDGITGVLGELHHGAGCKFKDFAHRQQNAAKLHGDLHLYVEDKIKSFFFHLIWEGLHSPEGVCE